MLHEPSLETEPDQRVESEAVVELEPKPAPHTPHTKAQSPAPQPDGVEPNYQYWRENGQVWVHEYNSRKKRLILYHIQELMLTEYVQAHATPLAKPGQKGEAPLRVLEFGCGVGRHLRNLTQLPGVDVYGYDQSRAMAEGCLAWTGHEWFDEHVSLGNPTGPLPYPDNSFDLVYTSEVLLHSRPEHLDTILSELIRVCAGHILHIETSQHIPLCATAHHGCWRHDLPSAYARLGRECESLPSGYKAHEPFRVVVGQKPRFTWSPVVLALYRRMEHDIDEGFAADAAAHEEAARKSAALLEAAQEQLAAREAQMAARDIWLATKDEHIAARDTQIAAQTTASAAVSETLELQRAALADLSSKLEAERQARSSEVGGLDTRNRELEARLQETTELARRLELQSAADRQRAAELEGAHAQANAAAAALLAQRQEFLRRVGDRLRP